ncbi:hypothetical protein SNEBB_007239 [Seison nebaliae]|nr:hypothetical protein SNEBB_007239 [Seison nebaliae]
MMCNRDVRPLLYLVFFGVALAMTFTGVQNLGNCPMKPDLPVYLLVGGCFSLVECGYISWLYIKSSRLSSDEDEEEGLRGVDPGMGSGGGMEGGGGGGGGGGGQHGFHDDDDPSSSKSSIFVSGTLGIFLLSWLGVGSWWMYEIWWPPYFPALRHPDDWCSSSTWLVAVSCSATAYGMVVLVILYCVICKRCCGIFGTICLCCAEKHVNGDLPDMFDEGAEQGNGMNGV